MPPYPGYHTMPPGHAMWPPHQPQWNPDGWDRVPPQQAMYPHHNSVSSLPQPNATPTPPPSIKMNDKKKTKKELVDEKKTLDLDTRIELILKGKTSAGMAPPFLQFAPSSDSDEENNIIKKPTTTPKKSVPAASVDSDDDDGMGN